MDYAKSAPLLLQLNLFHDFFAFFTITLFLSVRPGSASVAQGNLALKTKQTAERIVEKCLEIWGRLDVLVNNASQFYPTEMGQVNEEVWDDLIQTNMSAPFFLSQVG